MNLIYFFLASGMFYMFMLLIYAFQSPYCNNFDCINIQARQMDNIAKILLLCLLGSCMYVVKKTSKGLILQKENDG